jgi:dienelactone hydrolase
MPSAQVDPRQSCPQLPQLAASVCASTHCPAQASAGAGQAPPAPVLLDVAPPDPPAPPVPDEALADVADVEVLAGEVSVEPVQAPKSESTAPARRVERVEESRMRSR